MTLPRMLPKENKSGKIKSPGHMKWVRLHSCCVKGCTNDRMEAHHVRLGSHAGMGSKPGDDKTISLCVTHHSAAHRGEETFAKMYGLDLQALAKEFADKSPVLRRRKRG